MIELIKQIRQIAHGAGQIILEIYGEDDFQIQTKEDESPLTIADQKANDYICSALEQLAPEIPIISEENKEIPYESRKHFDKFFLVDPLDGTKEFVKRNGDFTVNVALIEGGKSVGGVVYIPVSDEMYWAVKGEGAYYEKNGMIERLEVKEFNRSAENLGIVCSRSHLNEKTQAFIDLYKNPNKISRGSSLKFLIIARNQAHIYPRLAPTMEWDTAAAQIILEEAGGSVYEHDNGNQLQYNKESLRNPEFVAIAKQIS